MNRNDGEAGEAHITAHDSHYRPEPDLLDKGLQHDSMGLLGSTAMAVSCVAPVYALTAALGPTVREVGVQMPAVFLAGFIPMLLVAFGYRALNKVVPDAGTSFTWTVKAFGPYTGWMCGWGLILATVIVLSNTAGVAATYLYLFLAALFDNPAIRDSATTRLVNVVTTSVFVAMATWVAYRGMMTAKRVTYVLVGFQMVILLLFCALARCTKAAQRRRRADRDALRVELAESLRGRIGGRAGRGALAVDLHLLGLGREPVGQRGNQRQRAHAGRWPRSPRS